MSDERLSFGFDRVTYRDGQLLSSLDLNEERLRMTALRWLHGAHVHGTWGILLGLEVEALGPSAIRVRPGVALDCHGRELILADALVPPLPASPVERDLVLTLSYLANGDYLRNGPESVCVSGGWDPSTERAQLNWRSLDGFRFGPEVPLVRLRLLAGHIQSPPDHRVRRYAERRIRPHIETGVSEEGRTGWRLWPDSGPALGIEVEVDTTDAGFVDEPLYFASLECDLAPRPDQRSPLFARVPWTETSFFSESFGFIVEPGPNRFVFRVIDLHGLGVLPGPGDDAPAAGDMALAAEGLGWRVHWIGLEPVAGCEPATGGTFTLGGFFLPPHLLHFLARES